MFRNPLRRRIVVCAAPLVCAVLTATCSSPKPAPPAPPTSTSGLLGDLKAVVSVKELMRDMIDPIADNIFDAVSTVETKNGTVEKTPKTDEDWEKIRIGAVTLAEGIYLLKVPRPFTPPGEENAGTDAGELPAAQIKARVEADLVLWNAKIEALRNVGLEVLDIVKRKDVNELWEANENLDQACEGCHIQYWYPGEKAMFRNLDRKLRDLYGQAPRPDRTGRER